MSRDSIPPPGRLVISSDVEDEVALLTLEGELDLASAGQVEERLAALTADSPKRIVVDLDGLAFIDSTGLRTLIQADALARENDCELVLRPGNESIQRVFELTGALDVLRFEPTAGEPAGS